MSEFDGAHSVSSNLSRLISYITSRRLPPIYVIIDEYDSFANHLITSNRDPMYYSLTADDSFFKTFFKVLKEGRETGAIANIFITSILPITIDDLASAFNVGTYLTLWDRFEAMAGFTQAEVDHLLDQIYADYSLDPANRPEIMALIKNQYDGYHFASPEGEPIYNATSLMYFLYHLTENGNPPESLTDLNLRNELNWIQRLTGYNPANTKNFVETVTTTNQVPYYRNLLVTRFSLSQFFTTNFYPISFFYLGMLTRQDHFVLALPNANMRQIFSEYFNELYQIDMETRYNEMMMAFLNRPNLEQLFAGYWKEYISQLPEAVFQKVNENFYRTTFYDLCNGYAQGLQREFPRADIERYVIYCIGNQGFRVFTVV